MSARREHQIRIRFNGRLFERVVIDQHYKEKHPEMSDELILDLVARLDGAVEFPDDGEDGFEYFRIEPVFHHERPYRLIITTCSEDFIGVINAFRVRSKK